MAAFTALWLGLGPVDAAPPDAPLVLRPLAVTSIAGLDIVLSDRGRGTGRRIAVSDLVVRLRPEGDARLAALLALADGDRAGRGRVLFTAEVLVVAGGRLYLEERARCAPWTAGASICRTECDGGAFAIVRQGRGTAQRLAIRFGQVDAAEEAGVRLGSCRDGGAEDVVLMPRHGKGIHEVPLGSE
jgi:hypothetical protein